MVPPFSKIPIKFSCGNFTLFDRLPSRLGGVKADEDGVLDFCELDHGDITSVEGICTVIFRELDVAVEIGD